MKQLLQTLLFCSALAGPLAYADFTLDDPSAPADQTLSLILAGARVYTGGMDSGEVMDVGILGDRIEVLGDLSKRLTFLRIDVAGLAVVPGFIEGYSPENADNPDTDGMFPWPDAEEAIRQGVTTVVLEPDDRSEYAISKWLRDLEAAPLMVNIGIFGSNDTLRGLGVQGRELDGIGFSEAILEKTRIPANRLHLGERGRIEQGAFADLVVLDEVPIRDAATFAGPDRFAIGILHVFVNGQPVLLEGVLTGERPGRILKIDTRR